MKKYLLIPDKVRSQHDRQTHYIDARKLARCYQVPMEECVILEGTPLEQALTLLRAESGELAALHVRSDGDYGLERVERNRQDWLERAKRNAQQSWVFLLVDGCSDNDEGYDIIGAFSTKEKAIQAGAICDPLFGSRYEILSMEIQ